MRINRTWRIVAGGAGAAALVAGLTAGAAAASDGIELRDRVQPIQVESEVNPALGAADDSPESADSTGESPFDSANSAGDSPGDPGWTDPSPESADSPNSSAADSPATPVSKPEKKKQKDAPAKPRVSDDSPDDSPAPVRKKPRGGDDSANSGGSADSGSSANSSDSAD
ncbi:hypothetical protein [Plantactinospora sonchi]